MHVKLTRAIQLHNDTQAILYSRHIVKFRASFDTVSPH